MKTITYLRLSLLAPFLVWEIFLLIFAIWSKILPDGLGFDGSKSMTNLVLMPVLFPTLRR